MLCKIFQPSDIAVSKWESARPAEKPAAPAATPAVTSHDPQEPLAERVRQLEQQLRDAEQARAREAQAASHTAREEGLSRGREEMRQEMEACSERLAAVLKDISLLKARLRAEAEQEIVRLSLAIARRILHREATIDPDTIHGLVHAALQKLQKRELSRIRVHPSAAESVSGKLYSLGMSSTVEVLPDNSLTPGGLIFETALGDLDASIDSQLNEIERGFADAQRYAISR